MQSFIELLSFFFNSLLRSTLQVSVLVCLILLTKSLLRLKLRARWHYCLWLLLLVRILLPWAPQSNLSVFNLVPDLTSNPVTVPSEIVTSIKTTPALPSAEPPISTTAKPLQQTFEQLKAISIQSSDTLAIIWLIGAIALAGYILAENFKLWQIVKHQRPVTQQWVLDLLEDCKTQMGISTILGVIVTNRVKSPALFGFIRPRLLLPTGLIESLTPQQLSHILLHELAHLKRHDIGLNWLAALSQALHWFNPLVWYAFYRMRIDRELACDALALVYSRPEEHREYGRTIVELLEKFAQPQRLPSLAGIIEDKSQLKRRITMIARFKKGSYRWSALAVILLAVLSCVALTNAQATVQTENKEPTTLAKEFVELLLKERFSTATKNFDATMKAAMTAKQLKEAWGTIASQVGVFNQQLGVRTEKYLSYDIVLVTCEFEKGPLDVKVVYNNKKQISGLFFVPTPQDIVKGYQQEQGHPIVDATKAGAKKHRIRHFAKLVIGKSTMTFQGEEVNWEQLPDLLNSVPERSITVFEVAFEPGIMPKVRDGSDIDKWLVGNSAWRKAATLQEQFGFEYLSFVGEHHLGLRGEASETYFVGQLEFNKQIPIQLESAEAKPLVKCRWLEFERSQGRIKALLHFSVTSHPKTTWEFRVRLLDAESKELKAVYKIFENSGIIETYSLLSEEDLYFSFDKLNNLNDAKRFEIRIHQISDAGEITNVKSVTTISRKRRGKSIELSYDDGSSEGKKSIAGSGHAVIFEAPGEGCVLKAVRIYGSRYGYPRAPKEDFHIWLCDENFNVIKDFGLPYSRFKKGDPRWVTLRVKPVEVPATFAICVGFNPEQRKGVYVHYDDSGSGNSFTGLPSKEMPVFSDGEWMIRAVIEQPASNQVVTDEKSFANKNLQKMINLAKPGDTVIVPKGVYAEPVTVTKPLTLKGESKTDCIFEVTANEPAIFIDTKGKGNVTIEDLTIKWRLATSDRVERAFALGVKDSEVEVKNCNFVPLGNFKRSPMAVKAIGFSKVDINTCRFEGFGFAVFYNKGTEGTVQDSVIANCQSQGITIFSAATVDIIGNIITGSKKHAVRNTGGTLRMKDNLIINNANRGVYLGNKSAKGVITNNIIMGNGTGISGFARSKVKIKNNIILNNSFAGIDMRDSCSFLIQKNILQGNTRGLVLFKETGKNSNKIGKNAFWRNKTDTENLTKTADSITTEITFVDPNNGNFSLKPGPALQNKQGLTNPQILKKLWQKWQELGVKMGVEED